MADKLERYLALVPLLRYHKLVNPGEWVRLEPETGDILGLVQAVPESALAAESPDPAVLSALVEARVAFAPGAVQYAQQALGLSAAQSVALAKAHAAEFVQKRGSGMALVQGIQGSDLERWAKK